MSQPSAHNGRVKHRIEALGEIARDTLDGIVRELLARKPGGHLVEPGLQSLDLRVRLPLNGDEAESVAFTRTLTESIDRMLDEAIQQVSAFRPGHAYCHRCESAECEHSVPPSCRHVSVGYAPTGMPRWLDFAQLCLDLKHPQVDRLYDQPPAFLTLVYEREELHGGILEAFRNRSYEVLGQVAAGFFPVRARAEEGRGVVALTFQAAASGKRGGAQKLGLNLLGRSPSGESVEMLWDRHEDLPWRKALAWSQSALQSVARDGARRPGLLERRVSGIMRGLARRLERDRRARSRRTSHAEARHASGQRPTRKAIDDARQVAPDALLVDSRNGTLVVLGDRGRTHFFTTSGQLVSSVRYSREAIERKIQLERWRRASSEQLEAFRAQLPD